MTLDNPIIIFGSGRNGSSALHYRLARHPHLAWISDRLANRKPGRPELNRILMHGIDLPIIGESLWQSYPPGECYTFWQNYSNSFRQPCRDLLASDVTNLDKRVIPMAFANLITNQRSRLLLKVTGWPRIGYLYEIFPNAKFIHIVRDGRAVANSLLKIDWWLGWRGPQNWLPGLLTPDDQEIWESTGRSFVALAGLQWKILCSSAEQAISILPDDRVCEVRYEDLCSDGNLEMERLLTFVGLDFPPTLLNYLRRSPYVSRNEKWTSELTQKQQEILNYVTRPYLEKHHYI